MIAFATIALVVSVLASALGFWLMRRTAKRSEEAALFRKQYRPVVLTGPRSQLPSPHGITEGTSFLCTDTFECLSLTVAEKGDGTSLSPGTRYWRGCSHKEDQQQNA